MKIIFFGTADISKYFLENINDKHKVVSVVTMCDKPVGRANKIKAPAIKEYAIEQNIPYIQVDKFNNDIIQKIKDCNADAGVVVSFGKIIPKNVFSLPRYGCFNIHFSLLPKYRGAAPVQQVLINGDTKTGVTAFCIEDGLDTGDILLQKELDIDIKDTSETLFNKLNIIGKNIMNEVLDMLDSGKIKAKKQEGTPSFCSTFNKERGKIDWNKSATEIYNLYRGLYLWPKVFCKISEGKMAGKILKILECEVVVDSSNTKVGTVIKIIKGVGFIVKCSKDALLIKKVQPESKNQMSAFDFLNGVQIKVGSFFL